MSTVNVGAREVAAKVVYYGPGLSGKTTNLKRIHDTVKPTARGEMTALATEGDRTLFFDFLPVKVERIQNFALRLGLYTVPGQVFYNATRKLVLQGADGVVFVADSQPDALERNVESFENLIENMRDEGIELEKFPLVVQYNKRDLKRVLPVEKLHDALNRFRAPEFEASATEGHGVMDSLKAVTRLVIRDLKDRGVVGGERAPSPTPSLGERGEAGGIASQLQGVLADPAQELELVQPFPAPPAASPSAAAATLADSDEDLEDTDPSGRALERERAREEEQPEAWEPLDRPAGSFLAALAPASLRGEISELEASFGAGDFAEVVGSSLRLLRTLAGTDRGEEILGGYLLGLDGRELRRLLDLQGGAPQADDAAFALYLLAQACARSRPR